MLCQLLLARIHLDSGRPERAKHICRHALAKLEQAETPALSYQAYFVLGLIEEELGDPRSGLPGLPDGAPPPGEPAQPSRSRRNQDRLSEGQARSLRVAGPHVPERAATRRRTREAAFVYIEQAKSRSLADLIAFRAQDLPASTETHRDLVEQVRTLREELNWYSRAIQLQESRRGQPARRRALEKLRRSARECEQRLVAGHGQSARGRRASSPTCRRRDRSTSTPSARRCRPTR